MDVVFLPGYACTSAIWTPVLEQLPSRYRPILVDWPRGATPGFCTAGDFSAWLSGTYAGQHFDCLVGHSMGGLVALDLLSGEGHGAAARLVLVETFVTPPAPFFRNLVFDDQSPESFAIRSMLSLERPHYAPALADSLREVDMAARIAELAVPVHVIHGDRGCGDAERVRAELHWPASLASRLDLTVIPNACHFPMLENPIATAEALGRVLG